MKKITYILLFSLFIGCKKEETNDNPPPSPTTDILINKNVRVIDSTKLIINPDPALINQGKYEYIFSGPAPDIKINDIIVGATDGGYIRKVSSITQSQNKLSLQTTQGDMEDIFQKAKFNFTTNLDGLRRGHTFDFNGVTLFQSNQLTIKLNDGHFDMDGDWNFGFDYDNFKLDTFEMSYKDAYLRGQFNLNVSASQPITLPESTTTLARVAKDKTIMVGVVPVVVYMEVELRCVYSAELNSTVQTNLLVTTDNTFDIGLKYKNSQWQNTFNKNSSSTISVGQPSGNAKMNVKLAIIPYVSFRLYRILGPYASIGVKGIMTGQVASPSIDWTFYTGAWLNTVAGVRANILGKSIFDKNLEWNTDTIYYQTPDRINKISGDNQIGPANQYLSQPLKVKVVDTKGIKQSNVIAYFTIKTGGGTVENSSAITDANGEAQTRWKPGNQSGLQYLEVIVKKPDGTLINGAPMEFACSVNSIPILTTASINSVTQTSAVSGGNITNDGGFSIITRGVCWSTSQNPTILNSKTIDGLGIGIFTSNLTGLAANTTYYVKAYATTTTGTTTYGNEVSFITSSSSEVTIGGQTWMLKNLDVSTYRNGDPIPQVTDPIQWANLTTGAWCYYNNDPANGATYGKLYNWYALNDARELAPPGWHIPSDAEWVTLTTFLGGESVAGGKMKDINLWNTPNVGATNSSGFTGLGGGYRHENSTFISLNNEGIWWSATDNAGAPWRRNVYVNDIIVGRGTNSKKYGLSVRCIKD